MKPVKLRPMRTLRSVAVLFAVAGLGLSFGCSPHDLGGTLAGEGEVRTETRTVGDFKSVSSGGSFEVIVACGAGQPTTVTVEAEANLLPAIKTTVEGGRLRIDTDRYVRSSKPVIIRITHPGIERVALAGSGSISVTGLDVPTFRVELSGSGNITAAGKAGKLDVVLAGSGNVRTDGLVTPTADLHLSGSGNISASATSSLEAAVTGSGNITYSGNPNSVDTRVTGSGSIRKR